MGLFSSKTKVYTDSQAYNLAGDQDDRPDVMKATVLRYVLGRNSGDSFSNHLMLTFLNSSARGDQRLFTYAKNTAYPYRMRNAKLYRDVQVDPLVLHAQMRVILNLPETTKLRVLAAEIDDADAFYFAEEWVQKNRPTWIGQDWYVSFQEDRSKILIQRTGYADILIDAPADLIWAADSDSRRLLYASYQTFVINPNTNLYVYADPQLFTYRMNSGGNEALDDLGRLSSSLNDLFPVIPLRQRKIDMDKPTFAAEFDEVNAAYRRLTGGKITSLLDQVNENLEQKKYVESIWLVKGVSLGTRDKIGKRYIQRFFQMLEGVAPTAGDPIKEMTKAQAATYVISWFTRSSLFNTYQAPDYGSAESSLTRAEVPPKTQTLSLMSTKAPGYRTALTWARITETQHVGNIHKAIKSTSTKKAKVGDIEFHWKKMKTITNADWSDFIYLLSMGEHGTLEIYDQIKPLVYSKLTIEGMRYNNYVYGDYAVKLNPEKALKDDPDSSPFIIPLHYPTWKSFSLKDRTQLSMSSSYLVFNSVQIVKVKWYQRGIFKVILAIAGIALALITGGASLAVSGGILGANVALGVALGASAAAAAVVGAIANYIAAIIISQLISWGATKLFGEKLGAILGAIIGFVAMSYAGQFGQTGNFNLDWSQMMRVDNLMSITNAVTGAYQKWLMADTMEIYDDMKDLQDDAKEQLEELKKLTKEILGETSSEIDPMMFTDATEQFGESSRSFLSRTLLTGSDIVALSQAMIDDFVSVSLELPKAV